MPYTFYNWLELAGLPGLEIKRDAKGNAVGGFYTGRVSTASPDGGKHVYCAIQGINKNKNPERHELIVLVAADGKVSLVERLVQNTDFRGHLGGPSLVVMDGHQLHITMTMDFDDRFNSRFPGYAFVVNGYQRLDIKTYRV